MSDKLLKIESPCPCPGTPEYDAHMDRLRHSPPFLMPEGPYERTGAQNWLPLVSAAVRTPKTEMVEVKYELGPLLDGETPVGFEELLDELDGRVRKIGGYPVFFRSGQTSSKHFGLDACVAKDRDDFRRVIASLVERSCMGFPDQSYRYLMVREMIPAKPVFNAYMPITREFRLFVENGEVSHIQPYWPEEAMTSGFGKEPDDPCWKKKLRKISMLSPGERNFLVKETLKAARACPGDWSFDWLNDANGGWWLIDMAAACVSYRWKPDFEIVASPRPKHGNRLK